jgi:hypothetical protein
MKRIRWGQAKLIETPGLGPELPIEVSIVHKPGTGAVQGLIWFDRPMNEYDDVLDGMKCSITQLLFLNPVIVEDGHTCVACCGRVS